MSDAGPTLKRLLSQDARWSLREAIEHAGLDEEFVRRDYAALGLVMPPLDARTVTEEDRESLQMLRVILDAGVPETTILALARVIGRCAAETAEATIDLFARTPPRGADGGRIEFARAAQQLLPTLGPLTATPTRLHLREALDRELTFEATHEHEVAVAFADLVGFTALADDAAPDELADVIDGLGLLAAEAAEPPVRLVKLLGDAAMLVGPDCEGVLGATCRLVQAAAETDGMPPLSAGVTYGTALHRAGDWYGRDVNIAQRLSGVAGGGEVVATAAVAERATGSWVELGPRKLKGVREPIQVVRWAP